MTADIRGRTVGHAVSLPGAEVLVGGCLPATVGSLLLCGDRVLRLLGVLVAAGAVACWVLWRTESVSTWCASAAVCSVVLCAWVRGRAAARTVPRVSAGR